jgi:hypothetical protein
MTLFWTEEEQNIAYLAKEECEISTYISNKLKKHGYNRSPSAVRNFFRRGRTEETNYILPIQPKVLLLDIETLPIKVFTWGIHKQVITYDRIIQDWCVLSWAAKWLFSPDMMGEVLTSKEAQTRNDKRILNPIWNLMDEADIVIAHNSNFDTKKLNARFFVHEMKPLTPYRVIDTLKQSRSVFGFTSHKLDYLSKLIANKSKLETHFDLWARCDDGDQEALTKMFTYNKNDVLLLEEAYLELRPWMKSVPNIGIYIDTDESVCSHCGSSDLEWKGYYVTQANKFRSFRCKNCGGIGRSKVSGLTKEQRKNILFSIAK